MAEAIAMRLAPALGKMEAHDRLERAARVAAAESRAFVEVLAGDPIVSGALDPSELTRALSPEHYLGSAAAFVDAVLDRHRKEQAIK
jgi:3-carboxy-cis,cis-muconate cycloisomerase